jgi:ketosteroid isomerase-like protein
MESPADQIRDIVNREAHAWDQQDVELLLSVFHPDAVWLWPQTHGSMDPLDWKMTVGRFDLERWRQGWSRILSNDILRNNRDIVKIEVSPEADAAVAVVDIDAEWRTGKGATVRWAGRAMKYYTRVNGDWKLIAHTGL